MSQTLISHILYCTVVPVFVLKYFNIKIIIRTRYNTWNLRRQVKEQIIRSKFRFRLPKLNRYLLIHDTTRVILSKEE